MTKTKNYLRKKYEEISSKINDEEIGFIMEYTSKNLIVTQFYEFQNIDLLIIMRDELNEIIKKNEKRN